MSEGEWIAAIVQELQDLLGQKLVAYVADASPRDQAERRLRALYRAVLTLQEAYGPQTIRAWLQGANPDLANEAPVEVLRKGREAVVIEAAERFTH